MKDWSAIAKANGFEIPPIELSRIASTLETLEEAFRPLTMRLTAETEPALLFHAEVEEESA